MIENVKAISLLCHAHSNLYAFFDDGSGGDAEGGARSLRKSADGDEPERTVIGKDRSDLSELAGMPIRWRFAPKDADLHCLRFR
jgi:hypothetical protein